MKAAGCNFQDKNLEFLPENTFKLIDKIWIESAYWSPTLILLLIIRILFENAKKN